MLVYRTGDFMNKLYLNLPLNKSKLFIIPEKFQLVKYNLEEIINENAFMKNKSFSTKVLFGEEIKSNNTIEGYNDNIEEVKKIIKNENNKSAKEKRILNLYNGYKFILKEKNINKDSLKELYSILSLGLLSKRDLVRMGEYYRLDPVYIYYSEILYKEPDLGMPAKEIDEYMNYLFDFINNYSFGTTLTDEFIKSQILHFYFVYIHPYYDINGRTSRTTSMWHLINTKAYPYIIFNRAIQINKSEYYRVIREVKKYSNVTFFINYMMNNVLQELSKESILNEIDKNVKLNSMEYQTLHYILSMKSIKSVKDFNAFYNNYNDKTKSKDIYEKMILPLLEKKVLTKVKETKTNMFGNNKNFIFEINKDFSNKKIKTL